jgi:DNA-binding transcriptional ArsR family regulator
MDKLEKISILRTVEIIGKLSSTPLQWSGVTLLGSGNIMRPEDVYTLSCEFLKGSVRRSKPPTHDIGENSSAVWKVMDELRKDKNDCLGREIVEKAVVVDKSMSRCTVYRALRSLQDQGLVKKSKKGSYELVDDGVKYDEYSELKLPSVEELFQYGQKIPMETAHAEVADETTPLTPPDYIASNTEGSATTGTKEVQDGAEVPGNPQVNHFSPEVPEGDISTTPRDPSSKTREERRRERQEKREKQAEKKGEEPSQPNDQITGFDDPAGPLDPSGPSGNENTGIPQSDNTGEAVDVTPDGDGGSDTLHTNQPAPGGDEDSENNPEQNPQDPLDQAV